MPALSRHDLPHGVLHQGNVLDALRALPDECVHCCVTSPPYWGLRDYGVAGQIGLEKTPEEYTARLVAVFEEVRRILRKDGTLWLNLGDCYSSYFSKRSSWDPSGTKQQSNNGSLAAPSREVRGLKPKNLVGIPWRVAFALQAQGWYLRQDIVWNKPNPMPESVEDRPTRAHEYLFLFSKSEKYFYDYKAVLEPVAALAENKRRQSAVSLSFAREVSEPDRPGQTRSQHRVSRSGNKQRKTGAERGCPAGTGSNVRSSIPWEGSLRNRRSVWTIATEPFPGAHFATFPTALVEPCILAGSPMGGTVLDPFFGSGTTGLVARQLRRQWVGVELNPEYCDLALRRVQGLPTSKPKGKGNEPLPLLQLAQAAPVAIAP